MPEFTVVQVTSRNEWQGQHGPMVSYRLEVSGPNGNQTVELNQKPDTAPPAQGQVIEGDLQQAREGFPPKLKKAPKPSGGGFGGGGGKPKNPAERGSIERQVAFKGACEVAAAMATGKGSFDAQKVVVDLFELGVALIQGHPSATPSEKPVVDPVQQAVENVQSVFPGSGPANPMEHALKELKGYLSTWKSADPQALDKYQMKLSSLGLETARDATDEQVEELISFAKGRAAKGQG